VCVRIGGQLAAGPVTVSSGGTTVEAGILPGEGRDGLVEIELRATPFNPAAEGYGTDRRDLGVVLFGVEFDPARRPGAGFSPASRR